MSHAAHAVRPSPAPHKLRAKPAAETPAQPASHKAPAPPEAGRAALPLGVRPSLRLGGLSDPEEHEAEHAAGVIAGGGTYEVRDPGGSAHLRARTEPGQPAPVCALPAAPVLDPGASGRVRRAVCVAPPVLDPGASGRVRRAVGLPSAGGGVADPETARQIEKARSAAATRLPPAVQARLERGFGERMDSVQVHAGPSARLAAHSVGARAYTEGERITLGPGESEHDVRLMAHEAAHVVQNRRAAGIFRALPAETAARRTAAPAPAPAPALAPQAEIRRAVAPDAQPVRRLPFGFATVLDKFADWANVIPGFRLLTLVLGLNPINMSHVDRSGANMLRAAVELIPFGGLIVKALDTYGIFDKGGAWVEQQVASLGMAGAALRDALLTLLGSLGRTDLFHPGDVWDRAKRIFTEPIDRLSAFFKAAALGLLDLIRDAVLKPLAALASKTQAWDLLCAVLGSNPITREKVTPSPAALIGGFMKLAGQQDVWESIQKANALQRCWAWFQKAMTDLVGFVRQVPALFLAALKSFQASDLLDLPGALVRVGGMFTDFIGKFIGWAGTAIWNLLEIVFDVVSPGALAYVKKTGAALKSILKNPLPFVSNLVQAAKLGFQNFAGHFLTHLKAGLIDWLTGSLPGVYIPAALSLPEVGKFALSVLGITWAQIRAKIVKALGPSGEKIMKGLEAAFDVIKALVTGGPAAAWQLIKDKLTGLKDQVIDGIIGFVKDIVVTKAIPKLVSLFIPGAGFIAAIVSIYETIKVFVEKLSKIAAAVKAFLDSIVAIAQGQIGGAAAKVESTLAGLLSLAISFFAGFVGLGNVASKVLGVIKRVQAAVDKGLDAAINWVITKAKALFAKLFAKGDKPDDRTDAQKDKDKQAGLAEAQGLVNADDFDEAATRSKLAPIKSRYRLSRLDLVVESTTDDAETFHFEAAASDPVKSARQTGKRSGKVGPLGIVRSMLSWEQKTLDHFLNDPIWKTYKAPAGNYKSAEIDIRHKVSISDTMSNTDQTLAPKTVAQAADVLKEKTVDGKNFAPAAKSKPGIVAAAQAFLQAANNDIGNLFLGDARVNRGIGRRYDAGWVGKGSKVDPDTQQQDFVNKWGFDNEKFTITIERKSQKRGTVDETRTLTPQADG